MLGGHGLGGPGVFIVLRSEQNVLKGSNSQVLCSWTQPHSPRPILPPSPSPTLLLLVVPSTGLQQQRTEKQEGQQSLG